MTPTERPRVLVIGATGFLGRGLVDSGEEMLPAARHPPAEEGWIQLDLEDTARLAHTLDRTQPDWVVNAAAVTSVDGCESDPEAARRVHVDAVEELARACGDRAIRLIQLSTNYVFDGEEGPYGEEDAANPLSVYGRTKLEGEERALSVSDACVVRTAVLYGYHPHARPNFVTWALAALEAGETIRVVTDEWSNPTYLPELVTSIRGLIDERASGIYHVAGSDYLTRFKMVESLCEVFGLGVDRVESVTSAELGQKARRPLRAGLRTDRIEALLSLGRQSFRQNLEAFRQDVRTQNHGA